MNETPRTVMIIDDDMFLLDMYAIKFKEKGWKVFPCQGGEEAIKEVRGGTTPDIILFDIVMPGMDGFEVMEAFSKEQLAPSALRVMLTNQSQDSDYERAKSLGAIGYLVKANSIPSEVVAKVEEMCAKEGK